MNVLKLLYKVRLTSMALPVLFFSLCLGAGKADGEAEKSVPVDPYIISINFPGGPLSKLVASLGTSAAGRLAIIQSENLDPILPAFSVQNADIDSVIVALSRIVEPQGYALNVTGHGMAVLTRIGNATTFISLQLENKIGNRSVEEIISTIQTACEFANSAQKTSTLRFKYHPGTKLLFIAGTRQEVEIALQVIGSLPDTPPGQPSVKK